MEHIKNVVEFSDMDIETKDKLIKELCSNSLNFYHCDFCKKVSECDFHMKTEGKPCNIFEVIDL